MWGQSPRGRPAPALPLPSWRDGCFGRMCYECSAAILALAVLILAFRWVSGTVRRLFCPVGSGWCSWEPALRPQCAAWTGGRGSAGVRVCKANSWWDSSAHVGSLPKRILSKECMYGKPDCAGSISCAGGNTRAVAATRLGEDQNSCPWRADILIMHMGGLSL